jgi:hypothetical protein
MVVFWKTEEPKIFKREFPYKIVISLTFITSYAKTVSVKIR